MTDVILSGVMVEQSEQYAAALAAFRRVTMLADEHAGALDQARCAMQNHAWVGGGAPRFAAALDERRQAVHTAFSGALRAVADLVVRQSGPPPTVPYHPSPGPVMRAVPGRFQGIEPDAMHALITSLSHSGDTLAGAGARLAGELSALGLPSGAGAAVGQVGEWADTQGRDLRRRLGIIQQSVPGTMSAGTAGFGLFAAYATGAGTVEALLSRLAARDASVVAQLLQLQEIGGDATLAARINTWWQQLAADLQEQLATLPGFGLLNGIPAAVRDRANRHWLASEKQRLQAAYDAAVQELITSGVERTLVSGQPTGAIGGFEKLGNQLRRIELIERAIQPRAGYPPPLLLGLDVTGQGRLIVSWGNPDTADITVTNVSGLTSGLDAAHGDLQRSRALWQQASKTAGDRSVASITWLGYDAPQLDPGVFDPGKSVAFEGAAAKGGPALASFADGLRATHEPSATARSVVIGHSYGSLTSGHAAVLRPEDFADDLILVGSPGVGVDHASQLGLDPKHVWVGEAGGDPVAALGRFRADPGHDAFGAQRLPVEKTVWTNAHSSYWDRGSASLKNMGFIINGQTDQLVQPHPLDQSPQLLMPEIDPELALQVSRSTP
ncbi:alpha/beta hydrolase [Nonomuraea sp. NPDC004354]